jgi:uncharacterized membrane protein YkgB
MDNKPVIETAVKDYNDKKFNIIKIDILLTILLIVVIGFLAYSIYPKIRNSHYMGNIKPDDTEVTTTTVSSEEKIDVEELESDNYVVYKVTNLTGKIKDITVRLNTYVNDSIENTLSYQASSINNNSSFYAYFKKSDLKIYDKYDYIINSANSIYSSEADSVKVSTLDYDQFKYVFTNESGSSLNNLNVIVLYYDSNRKIVDIEEKNKTILDNGKTFEVSIKKDYSDFDVFINEAYCIKKES